MVKAFYKMDSKVEEILSLAEELGDVSPKLLKTIKDAREAKKSLYITIKRAKNEYYLTDSMIKSIGEEDKAVSEPPHRAPLTKLYLIERIEKWISENMEAVIKSKHRREKFSKNKIGIYEKNRREETKILNEWKPSFNVSEDIESVVKEATEYYKDEYSDFGGKLTQDLLISYIRHRYTDYEDFLCSVNRKTKGKNGYFLHLEARNRIDPLIEAYIKERKINL